MRKDVKIIMAVCAIVLIGLIVYALFVPGEKTGSPIATDNSTTENNTTAENNGGALAPSTQPTVAESTATTQPSIAVGPTTAPSETAMNGNNGAVVGSTATGGAADWNKLLATGQAAPAADSNAAGTNTNTGAASASGNSSSPMMLEATGSPLTNNNTSTATPALASASPQTGSTTGQRTYIVKLGDTPTSIAQAEYGNGQLYSKILAANPKLNARHMHVGQKLIIPDVAASAGSTAATGRNANTAPGANPSPQSSNETAANGPHYTVVSGDNLQRISIKLYGSSAQWQKIYELNKAKIGSNPAHIHVGEVLQLPKAPTAAARSATAAR